MTQAQQKEMKGRVQIHQGLALDNMMRAISATDEAEKSRFIDLKSINTDIASDFAIRLQEAI